VKKISPQAHERHLAERKKELGLSGRDYVAKNDGSRRTLEKALLEELTALNSPFGVERTAKRG